MAAAVTERVKGIAAQMRRLERSVPNVRWHDGGHRVRLDDGGLMLLAVGRLERLVLLEHQSVRLVDGGVLVLAPAFITRRFLLVVEEGVALP